MITVFTFKRKSQCNHYKHASFEICLMHIENYLDFIR